MNVLVGRPVPAPAAPAAEPGSGTGPAGLRWDHRTICELVPPGATVLDLGCGDGELLARLMQDKGVRGYGIEKDLDCLARCVARGVPVLHADLEEGLSGFPDSFFDFVILERTLHVLHRPLLVLGEMLRVGRAGVVSFPNFGHERVVDTLARTGRLPLPVASPHRWYEVHVHPLTVHDFLDWADSRRVQVEQGFCLVNGSVLRFRPQLARRAEEVLFVVRGGAGIPA